MEEAPPLLDVWGLGTGQSEQASGGTGQTPRMPASWSPDPAARVTHLDGVQEGINGFSCWSAGFGVEMLAWIPRWNDTITGCLKWEGGRRGG